VRVLLDVSAVPSRPAGAGVYTVALARELPATGIDLVLAARRGDGARWRELVPDAELHAVVPDQRPARLVREEVAEVGRHAANHQGGQRQSGKAMNRQDRGGVRDGERH
jgi:hypothetical protein